jgi:hypothetical protein
MTMIQIVRYDLPAFLFSTCLFPTSDDLNTAEEIWQFMIDNLKPGWPVTLTSWLSLWRLCSALGGVGK